MMESLWPLTGPVPESYYSSLLPRTISVPSCLRLSLLEAELEKGVPGGSDLLRKFSHKKGVKGNRAEKESELRK